MAKLPQTTLNLLIGVLVVNVIGLWTVYLLTQSNQSRPITPGQTQQLAETQLAPSPTVIKADLVAEDDQQLEELRTQLDAVSQAVATLAAQSGETITTETTSQATTGAKEYVIYLGSGRTAEREWTTLEGTKISLDPANYPNFRQAVFQASLSILNGEVYARLVNNSTGAVFYETQVSHNTSTASWQSSSPFQLPAGSQEYAVQLRSSSGELAELAGARLIITTR